MYYQLQKKEILIMKKLILAVFVLTICGLTVPAQKSDDFNGMIKQYYAAWSTLDADKAAPFYAKDAGLVFFDITPLSYNGGWKQYHDTFMKAVGPTFASISFVP